MQDRRRFIRPRTTGALTPPAQVPLPQPDTATAPVYQPVLEEALPPPIVRIVDPWESEPELIAFERKLQTELPKKAAELTTDELKATEIRNRFAAFEAERANRGSTPLAPNLVEVLINRVMGFGFLTQYLADEDITEIMINGTDGVFVERSGKLERTLDQPTTQMIDWMAERLIRQSGRSKASRAEPIIDAYLLDSTRIHVVDSSLSQQGSIINIRKHRQHAFDLDLLVRKQLLPNNAAKFISILLKGRASMLVSGGTNSGKTTLLNALINLIPSRERIVVIEDALEIKVNIPNFAQVHTRPANAEGRNGVTLQQLVRAALRMRPDRIIVGETRGGEALDMLQAMNTGHDGSLTTNHANSALAALQRIQGMCFMGAGSEFPKEVVQQMIVDGIDIVIFLEYNNGQRRVKQILEVVGQRSEGGYTTEMLWELDERDPNNTVLRPTGFQISPQLTQKLKARGVDVDSLRMLTQREPGSKERDKS